MTYNYSVGAVRNNLVFDPTASLKELTWIAKIQLILIVILIAIAFVSCVSITKRRKTQY